MRLIRYCLALVLLAGMAGLLSAPPSVHAAAQTQASTFAVGKCPFRLSITSGQWEGITFKCGTVTVPEDHSNPNGKTIQLAVAVFKSSASQPGAPVIYLDGGPGGFTLAQASSYVSSFGKLLAAHDLILFDQRGVGFSTPSLYCSELTDLSNQQLGEVLTPEVAAKQQTDAALACRQRLVKAGVNLAAYNSAQDAADVDSIRQALGYKTLNLYGISYGTRLALTVMRDFPQAVQSTVIDSVVPLEVDDIAGYIPDTERVFKQLWDSCASSTQCNSAYPNLENVFYQTVDKLNAKPIKVTSRTSPLSKGYPVVIDGNALIDALFQAFYVTEVIPYLPEVIYQARDGQVDTIAAFLLELTGENSVISYGMYYSVDCQEEVAFTTPDKVKAAAQGVPPQLITAEMPGNDSEFDVCNAWGAGKAPAIENQPVKSDIPTLVMAGTFDPVTPPAYSKQVADELSKSVYVEIPNSGHGASLSGACPFQLVTNFFNQPTQQLDSSCVKQISGPQFLVAH